MTMADVIAILSSLVLLGTGLPALMLLITIIFPKATLQISEIIARKPIRSAGRGLLTLILMLIVVTFLSVMPLGPIKLLSFFILMGMLSSVMIGAAGLINLLGNRFQQFTGLKQATVNNLIVAVIFEFTLILPFIGWFVILPLTALMMFGAASEVMLSRISFRRRVAPKLVITEPLA